MVDARDIAAAAVVALTESGHEGKKYKITGAEAISNLDISDALSDATGRSVRYVPVFDVDAKKAMLGMGMPPWIVEGMTELNQAMVKSWLAGIEKGFELFLGRKLRTFRQFARDFRSAFV